MEHKNTSEQHVVNDPYETRLRYTHTVLCHTNHSLQWWSKVFF